MAEYTTLLEFVKDPEAMRLFQQERLILEVTELMCGIMKQKKMKRSELAEQLGLTKGRISQILNNGTNLTLRRVADIFTMLGKTMVVSVEDLCVAAPEAERPARTEAWPASPGNMWQVWETHWTQDHQNNILAG